MSADLSPGQIIEPPAPPPPKRKFYVSRRTFDGLRPRAPRVPTTAEDSLALRKAQLKRIRKAAARREQLLRSVPVLQARLAVEPVEYEPMAPTAFCVIEEAGEAP